MPSINLSSKELLEFKKFTEDLVLGAGNILLRQQNKVRVLRFKDEQDIVTTADVASEKFIIERIESEFPSHNIFSEESGSLDKKSAYSWIIDPMDGSKEYLRDLPLYNPSVCLEKVGIPIVSATFCPAFDRLYSAASGLGAFANGSKVGLSKIKRIQESFVFVYLPTKKRKVKNYEEAWGNVIKLSQAVYRIRGTANTNLSLCWLANGGFEAYINLSNPPKWHDVVPGLLIAKEAGAIVSNLKSDSLIVANNQEIYNQIVKILS